MVNIRSTPLKRSLSNMKLPMPKMKPKQKLVMLLSAVSIGVVVYLMGNAFSSKEPVQSVGAVAVKGGGSNQQTVSSKASENNEAQRKLRELAEQEREAAISDETDDSFVDGPNLNPSVTDIEGQEDDSSSRKTENVLDIGDIVKEIEAEESNKKKEKEEKRKPSIIEKASKKDELEKTIVEIDFDKRAYLANLRSKTSGFNLPESDSFKSIAPVNAAFKTYETEQLDDAEGNEKNSYDKYAKVDYSSEAKSQKDKALERYLNNRKSVLAEITGENTTSNGESKPDTLGGDSQDYPYKEVKTVGDMVYAVNNLNINTDYNNVIQFTIVAPGDMHGGVVSGSFTKIRDTVALQFNLFSKDGKSYPISATAIDPDTYATVFADDVDRHYFQRYGGIIISSMVEGYANSLVSSETLNTDNGTTVGRERVEDFSDRLLVGVGKAGERLAPMFERDFNRESTVHVYKDKPVGLLFLDNFKVPISE